MSTVSFHTLIGIECIEMSYVLGLFFIIFYDPETVIIASHGKNFFLVTNIDFNDEQSCQSSFFWFYWCDHMDKASRLVFFCELVIIWCCCGIKYICLSNAKLHTHTNTSSQMIVFVTIWSLISIFLFLSVCMFDKVGIYFNKINLHI